MYSRCLWYLLILCFAGCANEQKKFRLVPPSKSGIRFKNTLTESIDFNIFNYMYFYNGGGVSIGDLNGDKLPDIYFVANQEPNSLYLNKGNFQFREITEIAGVRGFNGWDTGVTMADVNNDGKLDIYVSYLGDYLIFKGKNQLFINEGNDENGIPRFTDRAMEYGLDLVGFSTQASFFDFDRDGDLDMFMLNHSLHQNGTFGTSARLRFGSHLLAGDKLLRNDNGHFIDVTKSAGILSNVIGYGLGVVVSDVNLDGWPDIYVGNDFHENDYLYMNNRDGTFHEALENSMMHTSRYTMGVDFADFNNDAFPDLISMDMLPEDPQILKSSAAEDPYNVYTFKLHYGYNHQFTRNALQVNNHDGTFSEIGLLAGISSSDWSWSALFADFDLDGNKDILVSNGIMRRPNDLDYVNFIEVDTVQAKLERMTSSELGYIEKMPKVKLPNYLFRNNGDSTFINKSAEWGLDKPSYSNGAAYADLDNDGDLDIVMNNVEDEAFVYENLTNTEGNTDSDNHYLQFELEGKSGNLFGIGTKIFLYDSGNVQIQECMPTRGFQSSVDYALTFGTGASSVIDSVVIVWNDGSFQTLKNVKTNQRITLKQQDAASAFDYLPFHKANHLFTNKTDAGNIDYRHKENTFVEFNREQLIPHMVSAEGPAVAVGDINGDGTEDIFLGGGKWQPAKIFVQLPNGKFKHHPQDILKSDSTYEDVDAAFFDADGDKNLDLFVLSGGNEFSGTSKYRMPRLYVNDGKGNFSKSDGVPPIFLTGSCVSPEDFDSDGDIDLFIGTRAIPWRYGIKPDNYLLLNDGNGKFLDMTDQITPELNQFGFVKDAIWCDIDNDKQLDLVVAAEWQPITIFLNQKGNLKKMSLENSGLENTNGWWNSIRAADFDHDGDQDFIAGNLGLNSKLKADISNPVRMYVADFDKNDSTDQILTHIVKGVEYPFHTRDEMTRQMPYLKKKFLSYRKFAEASLTQMFAIELLRDAEKYEAYNFESVYIQNLGNGKFEVVPLPLSAQFSTMNAILIEDFTGDGEIDVLLAGNFYHPNIQMGRYDASYGLLLKGNGRGNFQTIPAYLSGFSVKGQVRHLVKVHHGSQPVYLAIRNNDTVVVFSRQQALDKVAVMK